LNVDATPIVYDVNELYTLANTVQPLCNATKIELLDAPCTSLLNNIPIATLTDLANPVTPGWSISASGDKYLVPTLTIQRSAEHLNSAYCLKWHLGTSVETQPLNIEITDCATDVIKTMEAGPALDKYTASPITLFSTNKCYISSVEIIDTTSGTNLALTENTLASGEIQYSTAGHAVDGLITSDFLTVKMTNTVPAT